MPRIDRIHPGFVFGGLFALLLLIYWPARDAGWVSDTLGWLDAVRNQSFNDFINRRGFRVSSFYQTTQLATWSFYQIAGANRLAWHLLHIALQALNAALLFAFFRRLLLDSRIPAAGRTALIAVLLLSLSPYLSEVLVWEAAFHYLQGLLLIAAQLLLLQGFIHQGHLRHALAAGLLFAIASFSLELFYLTPAFSLLLLLFYRYGAPITPPDRIRRAVRYILIPQLLILLGHLALVRIRFGTTTGRLGDGLWSQPLTYYAIKPPDYLLHLPGGRFLPQPVRSAWHQFFCTYTGAGLFYAALAASLSYILFRFRRMSPRGQLTSWAWCATLAAIALVTPMWFPERLLVMGDRYLYPMLPFFLLIVSLLIGLQRSRALQAGLAALLIVASGFGATQLAKLWARSERLTQQMQRQFPVVPAGVEVILLNNPANLCGVPMTGAGPDGEFGLMRRLLYRPAEPAMITEAFAAEYTTEQQPVTLQQLGDRTYRITLVDSQRRWWFGPDYARVFKGRTFRSSLISPSAYDLRLNPERRPVLAMWTGRGFRFLTISSDPGSH